MEQALWRMDLLRDTLKLKTTDIVRLETLAETSSSPEEIIIKLTRKIEEPKQSWTFEEYAEFEGDFYEGRIYRNGNLYTPGELTYTKQELIEKD